MSRKTKEIKVEVVIKPFSKEKRKAIQDFIIEMAYKDLEKKFPKKVS